jgi:hypothetical protein
MENPLLKALIAYKINSDPLPLQSYLHSFISTPVTRGNTDISAHILDLLEMQREKCAKEVPLSYNLHETLKENIFNSKLI